VGLVNWKLRQVFDREIARREIAPSVRVRPLSLLSIEDLEKLLPYVDNGDFAFTEILEEYTIEVREPLEAFQNILASYLRKRNIPPREDEWVRKEYGKIEQAINEKLLG
jgi:hypothetical protein